MSDYIAATTHVDAVNHLLVFDTEGYYVVGDGEWQDITFTTTLTYNGGNIGIAPRIYDTNFYMYLSIHNEASDDTGTTTVGFASLNAQITYDTVNMGQIKIDPLVVGQQYIFKTEIKGTNYRIYLNDVTIFNIEYPGMSKGKVGVYSTAGNSCSNIEVQSLFADGWTINASSVPGSIVDIRELENEDKYIYIFSPNSSTVYARQTRSVTTGGTYTMSFNYKGSGKARIIEVNGATPQTYTYVLPYMADWTAEDWTQKLSADCTSVNIYLFAGNEELMANAVQFEEKTFATGYIHNESLTAPAVREKSVITYPSKDNIKPDKGSLAMWFKPSITYNAATNAVVMLFQYGDTNPIYVYYSANGTTGSIRFRYGTAYSPAVTMDLVKDTWYNVVATWSSSKIQFWINGTKTELEGDFKPPGYSSVIRIGHSSIESYRIFNGAIDETIILSSVLTDEDVELINETVEPLLYNDSMIMRATFNYAIGNFNKAIIEETLVPDYGSPVLVEKADGTPMRKVSFFDFYTGEYRTFNEELIVYDKTYPYLELSYHDVDIDQESFKINVQDEEGITYGEPYELIGRKLHIYLEDSEKDYLDGKNLFVTYQLEDSYTVDFNIGVPDSFRVTLGKHDGQPVRLVYEGNGFTDEKLATMVELNPLLNPNHEGFLYVTRNDEKVSSFRVRATPDELPANGGSEALVVVEPLDTYGNFISHCRLDVTSELGTIVPAYDEESIKLRDRAGRFLYRYRSPILSMDDIGALEAQDSVNIIDRETGLGVQVPITLTALEERNHSVATGETIYTIADKYGSTVADIMLANELKTRTLTYNQELKIPVNYSTKQLERAAVDIKYDKMIAYLTNMITDYMNMPVTSLPSGLGTLLDFNSDGLINIQEIKWLTENRLTTILETKYNAVVAWDNAN